MFCPRCGEQQKSIQSRFCSRCRFVLTGLDEIVEKGGLPAEFLQKFHPDAISPRKKGLKQGGILLLSSFILIPLAVILSVTFGLTPALTVITAVLTFWGGILRMIYALAFESGTPTLENKGFVETVRQDLTGKRDRQKALPPEQFEIIDEIYAPRQGNWRGTADLQPTGINENTTRNI